MAEDVSRPFYNDPAKNPALNPDNGPKVTPPNLSGSPSNPKGLSPIPSKDGENRAYVKWETKKKYETAMRKLKESGNLEKENFPKNWRSGQGGQVVGNPEGYTKQSTYNSFTVDTTGLTPTQLEIVNTYLGAEGINVSKNQPVQNNPYTYGGSSTGGEAYSYGGTTPPPTSVVKYTTYETDPDEVLTDAQRRKREADEQAIKDKEAKQKQAKKDPGTRYGNTGDGQAVVDVDSANTPPYATAPMSPRSSAHAQKLTSAMIKSPISTFRVKEVPSNIGVFNAVQEDLAGYKAARQFDKLKKNAYPGKHPIGFEDKIDVPAQIRIYTDEGATSTKAVSEFKKAQVGYIDCFLLTSVQHRFEERYFLFQSLNGDTVSFFFGNKPSVYSFSGILMDTYNQQWYNDFQYFYQNYLRGTSSISNKSRIMMVYEDQIIEGLLLDASFSKTGEMHVSNQFSFNMLLIQRTHISGYIDPVHRGTKTNSKSKESPGSTLVSEREHKGAIMTALKGASINQTSDTWRTNSAQALGVPAFDVENVKKELGDMKLESSLRDAPEAVSGSKFRDEIENIRPGTLRTDGTVVTNVKDLSLKSEQAILNTPAGGKYLPPRSLM